MHNYSADPFHLVLFEFVANGNLKMKLVCTSFLLYAPSWLGGGCNTMAMSLVNFVAQSSLVRLQFDSMSEKCTLLVYYTPKELRV